MEKIRQWSKKQKIIAGSAVGVLAAVGIILAVWQPWKDKPAEDPNQPVDPPTQGEEIPPAEEEKGPTLSVGGEKIPCTVHQGDGWSILVPEGWNKDAGNSGGSFVPDGATWPRVDVEKVDPADYPGTYTSMAREITANKEEWRSRTFYLGSDTVGWKVTCQAPKDRWDESQKLLTAMVRTMTVGEEKPFSTLSPLASEPDWQLADGKAVLFLDKDGYVTEEAAAKAVEAYMLGWPDEKKVLFTGKYKLEEPSWAVSYTCMTEGYVEVFSFQPRFQAVDGKAEEVEKAFPGWQRTADGWTWPKETMFLAVLHDGSTVVKTAALWESGSWSAPAFAAKMAEALGLGGGAAKAAAGETIALEEIGVTLVLPESWKGKCTVAEDKDGYVVYSPEIKKAFGGSEEDLFDGGMVCYIRRIDEVLTEEEIKDSEWDFAPNRYLGAGKDCTYLLYKASDVQFPPELQEEYQKLRDGIGEIQILQDRK